MYREVTDLDGDILRLSEREYKDYLAMLKREEGAGYPVVINRNGKYTNTVSEDLKNFILTYDRDYRYLLYMGGL